VSSRLELAVNPEPPEVMHIDLNSAFAMAEQQANPLLRHRPVGVTNRLNNFSICIAASYEAKKVGIGLGTRRPEALLKDRRFVMLESDPAKYGYVHKQLQAIFASYSPTSYMKSIDEGIIDFRGMRRVLKGRSLEDIGQEIKQRVRDEVGEYMKVNVGIAQNRWLAKVAAGFLKPDGLYVIDRNNLELVYSMMRLVELPYIKARTARRLYDAGITTTLEFYQASEPVLTKQVFRSVVGHHWYLKLRGYETEVEYGMRTIGRNYVLEHRTSDVAELATLLYKASVKVARRLSMFDLAARGMMLGLRYAGQPMRLHQEAGGWPSRSWYQRQMFPSAVRRGDQIFERTMQLFAQSPAGMVVSGIDLTAYSLEKVKRQQPSLFEDDFTKRERLEDAINQVNDKYGELMLQPVTVKKSKNPMKDKVPFGSIRYF
jgi:DNA polymerase IV